MNDDYFRIWFCNFTAYKYTVHNALKLDDLFLSIFNNYFLYLSLLFSLAVCLLNMDCNLGLCEMDSDLLSFLFYSSEFQVERLTVWLRFEYMNRWACFNWSCMDFCLLKTAVFMDPNLSFFVLQWICSFGFFLSF